MAPTSDKRRAAQLNEEGLLRYRRWEVEEAVRTFREAAELETLPARWLALVIMKAPCEH
jgi:Flp pilus assembly protein TadD